MQSEFVKKSTKSQNSSLLEVLDRWILKGWRVFISLKFGIFLLALIGIVSIWGTMGFASNAALGDNAIPFARTKVFEHPYFVALLLLFAINLIFSTWHVTIMSFGIWWKKEFQKSKTFYMGGKAPRAVISVPEGVEAVEPKLRKAFTRFHREGSGLFAHSGLMARMGPTIVHIGMLTVIFSVIAKAVLLWQGGIMTEGRFLGAEGEQSNIVHQPQALEQQITQENRIETPIDVWIKVLDFDEIKHPNSDVPAHFTCLLEVRDPRTQEVTVAELDMNHSLKIPTSDYGYLQFHQAGYQPVPPGEVQRVNFDVRDRTTGERIAVTDTHSGNRVRIGETDLFLEVDGVNPANRWRIYTASDPKEPTAQGLIEGGQQLDFAIKPLEFYTDFRIDPESQKPINNSDQIINPALKVALFLDDQQVDTTWLFYDDSLAEMMPQSHPRFHLDLKDVRVLADKEIADIDWTEPESAIYDIQLTDRNTGEEQVVELVIDEQSRAFTYESQVKHGEQLLGTEGNYIVRVLGPTQRYMTVLSVVNEPTVFWVKIGVGIILIGAMMTFISRYRAFYGLWDENEKTLSLALVPRWGQTPMQEEFDKLVQSLSNNDPTRILRQSAQGEDRQLDSKLLTDSAVRST